MSTARALNFFKHPQAIVETDKIGEHTRVWAFSHVLSGAEIGSDCNICDHVFIENDVKIGERVTIKSGVQIWDGVRIEDNVFVGPNVTFTNDRFPRSKKHPEKYEETIIRWGASLGANSTILAGITVGKNALVAAGAVVTRDVPPNAIVRGNPARITGYVDSGDSQKTLSPKRPLSEPTAANASIVAGVKIFTLPFIEDMRGNLSFAEYGQYLLFMPKRYFLVFDVPSIEVRGAHAHKTLHQFLVCIKGSVSVVVDDGKRREEIILDSVRTGIYIPPMVWGTQYKYSSDAVLLVLASEVYDPNDYIRDYDQFLNAINK